MRSCFSLLYLRLEVIGAQEKHAKQDKHEKEKRRKKKADGIEISAPQNVREDPKYEVLTDNIV